MPELFFQQAPQCIPVLTDSKDFWVNVVLAGITLLAVLVALFQEKIKDFFDSAHLELEIKLSPPDCHQIALRNQSSGDFSCNSIYIRIRVVHKSGSSAKNVEVIFSDLWEISSDGSKSRVKSFLPMNLIWSHFQPRTHVIKIPKMITRHCDFGFIAPLNGDGTAALKLDTIAQPNVVSGGVVPNIVQTGRYEFELLLTGDNVFPLKKKWRFEFDGVWIDDEEEMLRQHIKIEEI